MQIERVFVIFLAAFFCNFSEFPGKRPPRTMEEQAVENARDKYAKLIDNKFGAMLNVFIIAATASANMMLMIIPNERAVFLREYTSNMYCCMPYI